MVTAAENGPGTADVSTTYFDIYGRPIWTMDPDGFIDYTAYDQATGAAITSITDVNTADTGEFQNLPSGWSTPTGGGLNLITQMQVDALGRTTMETDPNGNVTYTVFLDPAQEVRVYPGWQSSTDTTTGPTEVTRVDLANSYTETFTMSATPHVTGGVPDGTEAISNLQTLSRDYTNSGGQVVRSDDYFNLSGVTYATTPYIGTQNTNYYTTLTDYDVHGRQTRVQTPTGTITRTVYDSLGRVVSTWVGTNDTPAGWLVVAHEQYVAGQHGRCRRRRLRRRRRRRQQPDPGERQSWRLCAARVTAVLLRLARPPGGQQAGSAVERGQHHSSADHLRRSR